MFDFFNRPRVNIVEELVQHLLPAATTLGLTLTRDQGFFRFAARFEGHLPGAHLALQISIPSAFVSSMPDTPTAGLQVNFNPHLPGDLNVRPAGLINAFKRDNLDTGDATFDDAFLISADRPDVASRLLDPETRDLLTALHRASDKLALTHKHLAWTGDEYAARILADRLPDIALLTARVHDLATQHS